MKNWQIILKNYNGFRNLPSEKHLETWIHFKALEEQLEDVEDLKKTNS